MHFSDICHAAFFALFETALIGINFTIQLALKSAKFSLVPFGIIGFF